jgi:bacillithiol system protein YtxJ
MTTFQEIVSADALAEIIKSSGKTPVLIFKHSNSCGLSGRAFGEFQKYLQSPESGRVSNYVIVVQKARKASDELAKWVGIAHESPQAIIVREGRAVWNSSHLALKSVTLVEAVESLESGSRGV